MPHRLSNPRRVNAASPLAAAAAPAPLTPAVSAVSSRAVARHAPGRPQREMQPGTKGRAAFARLAPRSSVGFAQDHAARRAAREKKADWAKEK